MERVSTLTGCALMTLTAAALSASMTVCVSPASAITAAGIVDCARSTAAASASSECETLLAEAFSRASTETSTPRLRSPCATLRLSAPTFADSRFGVGAVDISA